MSGSINDIIAKAPAGGVVTLPEGEFRGPIYISKPLHVIGSNTTIWTKRGNVVQISAENVTLENLRVELTDGRMNDSAVMSLYPAAIRNVEIYGASRGFGAEDIRFELPRSLELGDFAAEQENTYLLRITVPVEAEIHCTAAGVSFSPAQLKVGDNEVRITVSGFSAVYCLFAEVLVKSLFTRRMYITGKPRPDTEPVKDYRLKSEDFCTPADTDSSLLSEKSKVDIEPQQLPILEIRKLQKITLLPYVGSRCEFYFECNNPQKLEIDPYIFLLDDTGKSFNSRCLVFFGNSESIDRSVVHHPEDNHISVDFNRISDRVERIVIAYSVYGGNAQQNFSCVSSPVVRIASHGRERIRYNMYNLGSSPTIIAAELYRYDGEWKISAVGWSYSNGLAALCENYGITVLN